MLDIGTGGGDIPIALWRRARRRGLAIEISGCDLSRRAVQFAQEKAERVGAKTQFFEHDVIAEPLPDAGGVASELPSKAAFNSAVKSPSGPWLSLGE